MTIDLIFEDSVNRAVAGPARCAGPEMNNQDKTIQKALPAAAEPDMTGQPIPQPVQTNGMEQPQSLPTPSKALPSVHTPTCQDLQSDGEEAARIPTSAIPETTDNIKREVDIASNRGIGGGTSSSEVNAGSTSTVGKSGYYIEQFVHIRDLVQKKTHYPKLAVIYGWEGQVIVSFIILLDGSVKEIKVTKSSGRDILDNNAKEAVKLASPFPKPPFMVELKVPVTYKLLNKD